MSFVTRLESGIPAIRRPTVPRWRNCACSRSAEVTAAHNPDLARTTPPASAGTPQGKAWAGIYARRARALSVFPGAPQAQRRACGPAGPPPSSQSKRQVHGRRTAQALMPIAELCRQIFFASQSPALRQRVFGILRGRLQIRGHALCQRSLNLFNLPAQNLRRPGIAIIMMHQNAQRAIAVLRPGKLARQRRPLSS